MSQLAGILKDNSRMKIVKIKEQLIRQKVNDHMYHNIPRGVDLVAGIHPHGTRLVTGGLNRMGVCTAYQANKSAGQARATGKASDSTECVTSRPLPLSTHPSNDDTIYGKLDDIVNLELESHKRNPAQQRLSDEFSSENLSSLAQHGPPDTFWSTGHYMIHHPSDDEEKFSTLRNTAAFEYGLPSPHEVSQSSSAPHVEELSISSAVSDTLDTASTRPEASSNSRVTGAIGREEDPHDHQSKTVDSAVKKRRREVELADIYHRTQDTKKQKSIPPTTLKQSQPSSNFEDKNLVINEAHEIFSGVRLWEYSILTRAKKSPNQDLATTKELEQTVLANINQFPVLCAHREAGIDTFILPPIIFTWVSQASKTSRIDYLKSNANKWFFRRNLKRKIMPIFKIVNQLHNMAVYQGLDKDLEVTRKTHTALLSWINDLIFRDEHHFPIIPSEEESTKYLFRQAQLCLASDITDPERVNKARLIPTVILLMAYWYKGYDLNRAV
ncbi:uncharacterized protein PGTG_18829 [Puccinia graminis f. sp. tritici CRL 75-36-700-3]|uniref:Uncharacterized protein n=1 Tax=Puccinia graminis f. sp. tritici (strain CRL 75-36-700-3 / race SCCL) TaxID=418459 RepID=E3L7X6_PUCGT|nr:uncharacterized protein PGTG_18829 [Puccinia graminis f. sp. tritici CRL 75-36-700-3]EFP92651.2 hypothetical protein PGTG_18829 [Puccinia graminis f. sp. tritici CRL 75-36-700-3]